MNCASLLIRDGRIEHIIPATENTDERVKQVNEVIDARRGEFQSTLAPAWNQRPINARSSSVIWVALFMGICLVTTTCWYTFCACCLISSGLSNRTFFI